MKLRFVLLVRKYRLVNTSLFNFLLHNEMSLVPKDWYRLLKLSNMPMSTKIRIFCYFPLFTRYTLERLISRTI